MNKTVWQHTGLALFAAGVVALISILIKQPAFWIAVWAIITGVVVMAVSHYWNLEKIKSWFPIVQFFKTDRIATIRIEKKVRQTSAIDYRRDMKLNPQEFIFPYIQFVNISPLENGQQYLGIAGSLVSSLHHDLELFKVSVRFIFNSASNNQTIASSKEQLIMEEEPTTKTLTPKKSLVLWAENRNDLSNFRIYLTEEARGDVLKYYSQKKTAQVELQITGFDKNGTKRFLSTQAKDIALLD